uniref:Uncharacterized sensor-like histidine kinase ycf26 n=1 Tax=Riquetophycus sp. TaxID=1897556 RepID=A0A1C9C869_9FLOR|nr:hypothetical protein Riqu_101 [Riquetophycus sp.]
MVKIISVISGWWLDINLKTRLIVLTTLILSLIMSGLTFWALTIIQEDSIIADNRFCKDLGILFASNLLDLVETNNQKELASFVEKIYLSTSSLRYILLFRVDGTLFFGLPVYSEKVQNLLQLHRNLFQLETQNFLFGTPLIKLNTIFNDNITDIIIPLTKNGKNLGSLDLGINSNTILYSSSKLIQDISIAIFVSIWLIFVVGAAFNAVIITEPIKELLLGVQNIASGNFNQRINLPFDGELGELIISFNEMAEKLESYEQKNVDQLLLEKVKLEAIVSNIADGAILIDTELRVLFANHIAIKAFNWFNIDIIGKSILDCFPLHVNEALLPILNNWVRSTDLYYSQCRTEELSINVDYDSSKVFRFLLTTVLDYSTNMLTSVTIIIQDISPEVNLNDAKNQFIANVSHELRTPLCNISSFLETLLDYDQTLSSQQKVQFLNIANREAQRLSALVNDILDLSLLESEYNYIFSAVDLVHIVNNLISSYQIVASYNNICLLIEIDNNVKYVWANESALMQVFANLISNAIKFTSINGQIVLRIYQVNDYICVLDSQNFNYDTQCVRIEIIDEGIGINTVDQKSVFDRFFRIENQTHVLEGTGLGLSIVTNILMRHNTRIFIKSEILVGTSLWFDLLNVN